MIDDGSTDDTVACLDRLDVRWLRFPERMGIGSAMRAGLRYAVRFGYEAAVRIDGDGQHRADDIDRLLAPIREGAADVVLGSRYSLPRAERAGLSRLAQRLLGACISAQIGRRVTDPTSGFCALGRRAIRLLAEHHPTGYQSRSCGSSSAATRSTSSRFRSRRVPASPECPPSRRFG